MKRQLRNSQMVVRGTSAALVTLALFSSLLFFTYLFPAPTPARAETNTVITITPDQMTLSGDVATQDNTLGQCTESWLSSMPLGSIILGVDPASCDPKDWDGASASLAVSLPNVYASTTYVLKISWPDTDGKGLHSPLKNQTASISFDGHPIWSKRTLDVSNFGDYYGAQHEPIITTLVVATTDNHTLTFNVPPQIAWDLSQIELTAYPTPTKIHGIGYSPYRDCQYPGGEIQPNVQDVQEDLTRMSHISNALRTYSSTGINAQVPAVANALGMPVFSGAWLDDNTQDNAEIQGLIALTQSYHLDGVIVGNEYYLRHRTPADIEYLRQRILQVKNNIPAGIPVTTAEIDSLMFDWTANNVPSINPLYRPILDQLDIVMVHIYPFWSGLSIEGSAAYTINRYLAMQTLLENEYPGQNKRIIIGEAGWPSAGGPQNQAVPNLQNQRLYLLEFMSLAEHKGVEYFYFDGFDELWKIEEAEHVGQHWGFGYTDRSAKHNFYGVLLPAAQLSLYNTGQLNLTGMGIDNLQGEHFQEMAVKADRLQTQDAWLAATTSLEAFTVYDEWPEGPGHFAPSGWLGDIEKVGMYACERSDPYEGEMALRVSFSPGGNLGWGGVYWQYPENNTGNLKDGINLTGMNKITFWAKGEKGNEKIRFSAGGIGAENDAYPESLRPEVSTGFIELTNSWQQYSINLSGKDLSHVIGGFGWATDRCASPQGATFFLDKIQYQYDPNLTPPASSGTIFPIYIDASAPDNHYFPSGWMGDARIPGQVSLTECWPDNPHSGNTSIRVDYPVSGPSGWAAAYWLQSSENWGDRPGGFDLTGVERLKFWARTDTPGTQVTFIIGGVGYASNNLGDAICTQPLHNYPDSVCPKIQQVETLNTTWTQYTISLGKFPRDFRRVVGGFGWVARQPVTFYLDDIIYEINRPPVAAKLTAPKDNIGMNYNPIYSWEKVTTATRYRLSISGPKGKLLDQWYEAASICDDGTCSVNPGPSLTLSAGNHSWWVQTYNSIGNGPWSAEGKFSTSSPKAVVVSYPPAPVAPATVTPIGVNYIPTYTWDKVDGATYYRVVVKGPGSVTLLDKWYKATEVCPSSTCSAVSPILKAGTHSMWVQSYNPSGSIWSAERKFSTSTSLPDPAEITYPSAPVDPATVTPIGLDYTPTYKWSKVLGATAYRLNVRGPGNVLLVDKWVTAADACDRVEANQCQAVSPLLKAGTHSLWIQTASPAGMTWSAERKFNTNTILPLAPTILYPEVGVAPVTVASIGTNYTPTFIWTRMDNAVYYRLNVRGPGNVLLVDKWVTAADVCDHVEANQCRVVSPVTLKAGTHSVWVYSSNPAGGAWSAERKFSTSTTLPAKPEITYPEPPIAPATVTPIGANYTPTFTWNKVDEATYYRLVVKGPGAVTLLDKWYKTADVCPTSTCSQVSPTLKAGTHSVWVMSYNPAGSVWSAERKFSTSTTLPGAATLISPNTALSNFTPTYKWNKVPEAASYRLVVKGPGSVTVLDKWYTSATVCDLVELNKCEVTSPTPKAGSHTWWVQTYNPAGYTWSGGMTFSTPLDTLPAPVLTYPVPAVAGTVKPIGTDYNPSYAWQKIEAATYYHVVVKASGNVVMLDKWFPSSSVCGLSECAVPKSMSPTLKGATYSWWMQAYSPKGNGLWTAETKFSTDVQTLPTAVSNLFPTGTTSGTPTYSWDRVGMATSYRLYVKGPYGVILDKWYRAADICDTTTCSVVSPSLTSGDHIWWVQTYNSAGYGPWKSATFKVSP